MADAGFGERKVPDGRVLRLCSDQAGATISPVGRELGICHLRDLGYVVIADSPTSKWEKSVVLTARGINYLRVKQTVARAIEVGLRAELGEAAFSGLVALLDVLGTGEQEGLRTYLQRSAGTY